MSPLINLEALASLIAKEMRDRGLAVQSRLFDLESAAAYLGMTPEALKTKALQGKFRLFASIRNGASTALTLTR